MHTFIYSFIYLWVLCILTIENTLLVFRISCISWLKLNYIHIIFLSGNIVFWSTFLSLVVSEKFCNVFSDDSSYPLLHIRQYLGLFWLSFLFLLMGTFFFSYTSIYLSCTSLWLSLPETNDAASHMVLICWEEHTQCLVLVSLKPNFHKGCHHSLARERELGCGVADLDEEMW